MANATVNQNQNSTHTKISSDWQPVPMDNSNQEFQQLQLPLAANSEWVRRLKNADPTTVHRSTDCIVTGTKAEANVVHADAEPLKVAPSWTNVAQRSESISSTSGVQASASKKSSIDDEAKGKHKHTVQPKNSKHNISIYQLLYIYILLLYIYLFLICSRRISIVLAKLVVMRKLI